MRTFVTTAQVDAHLPTDWQGGEDKDQAVQQANIFLSAQNLNDQAKADPTPDAILQAGAYAAQEAAAGKLFKDQGPAVKRKKVSAGSVSTETEYSDSAVAKTAAMQMVMSLLKPYLAKRNGVQILGRL